MQIKTFLVIFVILLSFAVYSCSTSNKNLFEKFTDIQIPNVIKVVNDKYQDMEQDYGKTLELQLDAKSKRELELSIFKSKYFNSSIYKDTNIIEEGQLIQFGSTNGLWYKDKKGYSFFGSTINRRDNVTAIMDTIKMIIKFQYLAD